MELTTILPLPLATILPLPLEICLYIERILLRDRLWHNQKIIEKTFVRKLIKNKSNYTGDEYYYSAKDGELFITHYKIWLNNLEQEEWVVMIEGAATKENMKKHIPRVFITSEIFY